MIEQQKETTSLLNRLNDRLNGRPGSGRLEWVDSWGRATGGLAHVYRPVNLDQLRDVFKLARRSSRTVGFRGGGNSYGDAAMNDENIIVDIRRMNRILEWDPQSGRIVVEPGVTLEQLFMHVVEDGWWPPVCTGTMKITIAGGAAMNVHGKNAYKVGTIGDNIDEFDLMLPSGEIITCSREENSDIFHAAIGGMGMLGCFTSLTLQMKPVYSGYLEVDALATPDVGAMIDYFEPRLADSDYLVGWIDSFDPKGRGEIHRANYLPPGEDPAPEATLRLKHQILPDTFFGVVPKSMLWMFMRPFVNNLAWRYVNLAKYVAARVKGETTYRQTHVAFHFLLDYVPNFKRAYGPGGLIQYQCFVPKETTEETFRKLLEMGIRWDLPNYLSVFKRHKPDPFLLTHGLDGYSLAMDFKVTPERRPKLQRLARAMDQVVLNAGGRFYFAKDITMSPDVARAFLGQETIAEFKRLKERCDPDGLLETNMWRRLFG